MAGWVGRRCPVCHRTVKATELRGVPSQAVPGGTWYLHKTPRSEHAIVAPTVQNAAIAACPIGDRAGRASGAGRSHSFRLW